MVLDCAPISFMDAMGVKTLQQVYYYYYYNYTHELHLLVGTGF